MSIERAEKSKRSEKTDRSDDRKLVWMQWWKELQENRAGRAELRRCGTVVEAAFCGPFHHLRYLMKNPVGRKLNHIGLIVAVLAHVDEDAPNDKSLAASMAQLEGEKAIVSDSRFRQILRCGDDDFDELLRDLVRVLRQLNGRAPIKQLGEDLWWWTDRTRRQWAIDYYERAIPERSN